MATTSTTAFDLDLIDQLIEREEAALEPKHRASIEYRAVAERHVAGGVASSWQDSPPHAIYVDRGQGNRLCIIAQPAADIDTLASHRLDAPA